MPIPDYREEVPFGGDQRALCDQQGENISETTRIPTVPPPPTSAFDDAVNNSEKCTTSVADDIRAQLEWMSLHVEELATTSAGTRQLEYLKNKLVSYRKNVEENTNRRSAPAMFENADTVYLP